MTTKTGIGSYPADDAESPTQPARDDPANKNKPANKGEQSEADIQDKLDRYRDEMTEDAPASDDQADRN